MEVMAFWVSVHTAHTVTPHTHDFYQLIYCKAPGGYITVGSTRHAARADHVYLAKPGVMHAIEGDDRLYILELKFLAEGEAVAALNVLPDHYDISDLPFARSLLLSTVEEGLCQNLHYNEAVNSALKLFIIHSIRKFSPEHTACNPYRQSAILDIPENAQAHNDVRILNLKYYISNRLHEQITLSELAAEVNFNKTFFVKRFQSLFGMPPMKYVNVMRLARAKQLLVHTALPISTISARVGFNSPHYFSRSFRASERMSPLQFREKYKKQAKSS